MSDNARLDLIDFYRGLAIAMVALFHYSARMPESFLGHEGLSWSFPQGWVGVHFFFIISGFCILMTLERARDTVEFLAKRVARIYPTFVISMVLTFVFFQVFPLPENNELPNPDIIDFLGNFILGRDLGFEWVSGVYWSLLVELKYYVWIALLCALTKKPLEAWLAFCIVGACMLGLAQLLGDGSVLQNAIKFPALRILIAKEAAFFGIGMCFYRAFTHGITRKFGGLLALFTALALWANADEFDAVINVLVLAMLGLFFLFLRFPNLRLPKPCLIIGAVSYPMYLLHESFGYKLLIALNPIVRNPTLAIVLTFASMVFMAYIAHVLYELRFNSRTRRGVDLVLRRILPEPFKQSVKGTPSHNKSVT